MEKIIKYYENGNIRYEKIYEEDKRIMTGYYENGNIKYQFYYKNKKLHRLDGPAYIKYHENGNVKFKEHYINDKKYNEFEYYILVASLKSED